MNPLTVNVTILKILGLITLENSNPLRHSHLLYRFITYSLLTFTALDLLNIYRSSISLVNFVDIFPATHITVAAWLKASTFVWLNKKVKQLLPMMEGFQNQVKTEIFVRKLVFAATLISTIPVTIALLQPRVNFNGKLVPFHSSLPFDYKDDFQYLLAYTYQSVGGYYVIFIDFEIALFLISLFVHCAHQLRVVQRNFLDTMNEMSLMRIKGGPTMKKECFYIRMKFRKTVQHHAHILRFIFEMNQQLSIFMLLELLSSLSLFGISIINATRLANGALLGYMIISAIKLFLSSFYSEVMSYESVQISHTLYMAQWEKLIDMQKDIRFVIQRGQRQSYITYMFVNKFGLNVFLWMLKASYSYYTLLQKKLNEQKGK